MCVYLRTKFQVPGIILTSFIQREIGADFTPPLSPLQNEPLNSPPRLGLKYHLIPPSIINLMNSLYSDYFISITTKDFITNPIKVNHGVLQGDCLSQLIFNLCINTLIKSIENEKVGCLG